MRAIRAQCRPGFLIELKLPGDDGVKGGIGPAEAGIIAAILCVPGQVDYVAFGFGAHAMTLAMHVPDRFGPRLTYIDKLAAHPGPGRQIADRLRTRQRLNGQFPTGYSRAALPLRQHMTPSRTTPENVRVRPSVLVASTRLRL